MSALRVSITGATGFIGQKLVTYYAEKGAIVRVLSRGNGRLPGASKIFRHDLAVCDSEELIASIDGSDIVYHCAAEIHDERKMWAVNVAGTQKMLAAVVGRVGRFVQLSSAGVYGPQSRGGIVDESCQIHPRSPYEKSKAEADKLVLRFSMEENLSCCLLRPSIVYGPDMSNESLYRLISMIKRGRFFYIGRPGATMNYIHVDNVIKALECCGTAILPEKNAIYIISDCCTVETLVPSICKGLGVPVPKMRLPENLVRTGAMLATVLPNMPLTQSRIDALTRRVVYSAKRIQTELGYRHKIAITDGFQELVTRFLTSNRKDFLT